MTAASMTGPSAARTGRVMGPRRLSPMARPARRLRARRSPVPGVAIDAERSTGPPGQGTAGAVGILDVPPRPKVARTAAPRLAASPVATPDPGPAGRRQPSAAYRTMPRHPARLAGSPPRWRAVTEESVPQVRPFRALRFRPEAV